MTENELDEYGKYKLHILRHSLGLQRSPYKLEDSYRNRFMTHEDADNYDTLKALVSDGLMSTNGKAVDWCGNGIFFYVTEAGKEYVKSFENINSQTPVGDS